MRRRLMLLAPVLLGLAACQEGPLADLLAAPKRNFTLFFSEDSALLGDNARGIITMAADYAKQHATAKVVVQGLAAPDTGTARFNRALSEARAHAVADALVEAGIASARITSVPRGAVPFQSMPTESRRVDIEIGG